VRLDAGLAERLLEGAAEAVELDGAGELRLLEQLALPRRHLPRAPRCGAHRRGRYSGEGHLDGPLDAERACQVAA